MRKYYKSFNFLNKNGLTLVEILVALVILLLVVTACFPLFTLAAKITSENRARTIANELAKSELERTLAQVNATNYISEADDIRLAPLKTGVFEYYFDDNGKPLLNNGKYSTAPDPNSRYSLFKARKIVQWIDDPADGKRPDDKNPFDYKVLTIEVSCPSQFTGKVVKKADFKTFVAREGSTSPITGVIIEVVRGWTDENGGRIPIEGVNVSLDGTGPSHVAVTNMDGQALIPIEFPNDNTEYSYEVKTERLGMINRPNQPTIDIKAQPYVTNYKQIEMEEPATLTVSFEPSKKDFNITLEGNGESRVENIAAHQNSITFNNLWPLGIDPDNPGRVCGEGYYTLSIDPLLVYPAQLNQLLSENGLKHPADEYFEDKPPLLNMWDFESNYKGIGPAWEASAAKYDIHPDTMHRLALLNDTNDFEIIDLTRYKPASGITAQLKVYFNELGLSEYTSLSEDFILVYIGKENANLDSDDANDWTPYIKISKKDGKWALIDADNKVIKEETDDHKITLTVYDQTDTELVLNNNYFSKKFKFRFDSSPAINTFFFRNFNIYCSYSTNSIQFSKPAHNLTLKISGK